MTSRSRRQLNRAIALALVGVTFFLVAAAVRSTFAPLGVEAVVAQSTEPDATREEPVCTDCHREHQDHDVTLTEVPSGLCQSCHTDVKGFAAGHPEFKSYPHNRRTRINYDHVVHERKHFPESEAVNVPGLCGDCHQMDPRGERMLVTGFESMCAACHAGEIRGESIAGAAGISVITVPGLDLPSLREAEAGIGDWPELSDRELSPFMRAVFAGDPALRDALKRFDELDPLDLRDAEPGDIEAVQAIAWGTKKLLYDLIAEGPAALQPRLDAAFGRELGESAAREMLGGVTLATVRDAQAEWFPDLFHDISIHDAGESVPMPASKFSAPAETTSDDTGTTGSQESILGDDAAGSQESILGDDAAGNQESILGDDAAGGQESILGDDAAGSQESILGDDAAGSQESILGDDAAGGQESILGEESEGGNLFSDDSGVDAEGTVAETTPPEPNPEDWARLGGWYRDYFALLYRPSDHGDRFVKRWLDLAAISMAGDANPVAAPILDRLASDDAPGKCIKCHSVDKDPSGGVVINWRGKASVSGVEELTRFTHDRHLILSNNDEGCSSCHATNKDADYQSSFEDRDPMTYESNFRQINIAECGECHTRERAGNGCVQCHNYHVDHAASGEVTSTDNI